MAENEQISALTWEQARQHFTEEHSELIKIIDDIDPPDSFKMYKVDYRYGDEIIADGGLLLPNSEGHTVPLLSGDFSDTVKHDLFFDTGSVSAGLVLSNSIQISLSGQEHLILSHMFGQGYIFGLWAALAPEYSSNHGNMWHMSAGAHSLFMLPKISDKESHIRLQRELGINSPQPKSLREHSVIFKDIARARDSKWRTQILFFSYNWLQQQHDPAWFPFYYYLYKVGWRNTAYARNKEIYDYVLSVAFSKRNLSPDPYLSDTVKYLIEIALGESMGFAIAENDSAAPVSLFEEVYANIYSIKHYAPIFMQPTDLSPECDSVYYSLQFPVLKDFSPKRRRKASKLFELEEVRHTLRVLKDELLKNEFAQEQFDMSLYNIMRHTHFDFFHTERNLPGGTQHASAIPEIDPTWNKAIEKFPGLDFCDTSSFFWGCSRIYQTKPEE